MEEYHASQAVDTILEGFEVRVTVKRGNSETGHEWLGGRECLYETSTYFLGLGKLAEAELEDCNGVH